MPPTKKTLRLTFFPFFFFSVSRTEEMTLTKKTLRLIFSTIGPSQDNTTRSAKDGKTKETAPERLTSDIQHGRAVSSAAPSDPQRVINTTKETLTDSPRRRLGLCAEWRCTTAALFPPRDLSICPRSCLDKQSMSFAIWGY